MLRLSTPLVCVLLATACGGPEPRPATSAADETASHRGSAEAAVGVDEVLDEEPDDGMDEEPDEGDEEATDAVVAEDAPAAEAEADEPEAEPNPDSISDTPSHATFTRCAPADCEDCGVRVALRRRRGWRAAEYGFEILTEGNHIRCAVTLPCDDPAPVACSASPGAPRVVVETTGCGAEDGELAAIRFEPAACPVEMRIESYRDGIRAGVQDLRPRYTDGRASATHDLER